MYGDIEEEMECLCEKIIYSKSSNPLSNTMTKQDLQKIKK